MIELRWRGGIGYGDIISPLCYAHVISQRNGQGVKLTMHWPHKRGQKYKETDPETIDERLKSLWRICKPAQYTQVFFEQTWGWKDIKLERGIWKHINYIDDGIFHNYWFSRISNQINNVPYIALNTTDNHKQTLKDYGGDGKTWKDPVGVDGFKQIEKIIREYWNMDVVRVDYSTPTDDAVDIYRKAFLAIGYHGSTMWLAKYLRVPMIIFSTSKLTKRSFPFAIHRDKLNISEFKNMNPYEIRKQSLDRAKELDKQFELYLNIPNVHKLNEKMP